MKSVNLQGLCISSFWDSWDICPRGHKEPVKGDCIPLFSFAWSPIYPRQFVCSRGWTVLVLVTVWWLPPPLLYQSENTKTLFKDCLVFDQSPTLSIHTKTKNSSRDDARQIRLTKLYVLVWGRWSAAGLFQKLVSAGTEPREKSVMLQIVLGESLSFLDHCFMLHKGDWLLWSSGRLTAFPFCHSGTSHCRCLLQREEVQVTFHDQ